MHLTLVVIMQRKPLLISGNNAEVMVDVIGEELDVPNDPRRVQIRNSQEVHLLLLSSQVLQLRMEFANAREESARCNAMVKSLIAELSNNVTCLANRPALRSERSNASRPTQGGGDPPSGITSRTTTSAMQQQGTSTQADLRTNAMPSLPNSSRGTNLASTNSGTISQSNTSQRESAPTVGEICVAAVARGELGGQVMGAIELVDEEGQMVERAPGALVAKLIKCPWTLYDLWKEYIFGFAGHKPA
jgi:hypothetical protein